MMDSNFAEVIHEWLSGVNFRSLFSNRFFSFNRINRSSNQNLSMDSRIVMDTGRTPIAGLKAVRLAFSHC